MNTILHNYMLLRPMAPRLIIQSFAKALILVTIFALQTADSLARDSEIRMANKTATLGGIVDFDGDGYSSGTAGGGSSTLNYTVQGLVFSGTRTCLDRIYYRRSSDVTWIFLMESDLYVVTLNRPTLSVSVPRSVTIPTGLLSRGQYDFVAVVRTPDESYSDDFLILRDFAAAKVLLKAIETQAQDAVPVNYTITTAAAPIAGGTTIGGGTFASVVSPN